MHLKHIKRGKVNKGLPIIVISPDSYIRLTFEELRRISLVHLISGIDEDTPVLLQKGVSFSEITGYTEWVSNTEPAISIGWDWIIQTLQAKNFYYRRVSEPRSNLMLIDAQQRDLGPVKTAILIEIILDEMNWQSVVQQYISTQYAAC